MRGFAGVVVAASLFVAGSAGAADKNEAKLEKKLEQLEKQNAELKERLSKAQQDTQRLFDEATRAEKNANLSFNRATAVASQSAPANVPPVDQPATKHGLSRLSKAELTLTTSFTRARTNGAWRIYDANCDVAKKNR